MIPRAFQKTMATILQADFTVFTYSPRRGAYKVRRRRKLRFDAEGLEKAGQP